MGLVEGKVAFITGAARGQGRSHAVRLAQEGADIIAVDVCGPVQTVGYNAATADDLAETVRQVEALDRRIVALQADVRDQAALRRTVDDGVAQLGRLDIVLANAGIFTFASIFEIDEVTWQTAIDVNLTGVWNTVRAALPHLLAGGHGGSVVITSSMAGLKPSLNTAHYSAAKAGLVGLMQNLALELAPHDVRVNSIHPSTVATDMIINEPIFRLFRPDLDEPGRADVTDIMKGMHALDLGWVEPDDVSNAVLFLAGDEARFITGVALPVDGGALVR
jgi:SDR family mycofactocin-dependent oxidoreductase